MEEKEFLQWLEFLIYALQLPKWPLEKINCQEAKTLIANFLVLDSEDPEFFSKALSKINEMLAEKKPVSNIPPNLKELVADYENYLQIQETQLQTTPSYWEYYQAVSEEILKNLKNPWLAKAVSIQVTYQAAKKLPQVAHLQAFEKTVTPEEYQETIQTIIQESLPPTNQLPPEANKFIAEKTRPLAAKLAATPHPSPIPSPPPPVSEKIPPEIITKITAEPQGVAFKPIFTLLHPPTAISFAKKVILTPLIKPFQWAVKIAPEEIPEERKKAVLEGLTSKDIQESIKTLQKAGLSSSHPKIGKLKNLQERLEQFESSHKILSFFLRHYHEFSKITGSRQIKEPETGLWLPQLSPKPAWQEKKGYVWRLKEGLNRLGVFLHTHQWLPAPSGRKIIQFVLPDKIIRFVSFGKIQSFTALKTAAYKKLVQPVLVWLGKTALGKAIKTGAKKLITWGLGKLGLAAIPEPVVSKVLLALSFLKDAASLAKRCLKKLLEKPELAILGGLALIGLPILIPMLPVLKFILTAAGVISAGIGFLSKAGAFITGIAGKIGSFLSTAASSIGGFFSSLSTISLPTILPTIAVGGSVGAVVVATTLVVVTAGSVFIQEGIGEQPPYIGTPINPRPPLEAGHLAETVIWTLNECGITAVNKNTWSATENCLSNSNLPNKEIIIDRFYYSVFNVGPGLQCVGFVRGITAALGKELEGGRQAAKDYLDPPTPSGYYPLETDMSKVKIGDLVIMRGITYGHIAIVVNIVEKNGIKYLHIAEALGTNNGLIRITEVNSAYFDGFLRAK